MKTENLKVKGRFEMRTFKDGKLIDTYIDNNLVVAAGRNAVAELLGNTSPNKFITEIKFGEEGTPPSSLDTGVLNPFTKAVTAVSYPAIGEVKFDWSLELAENNGVTIKEYGLFCSDGTMFARKTGTDVVKTNLIRLEGSWTILF